MIFAAALAVLAGPAAATQDYVLPTLFDVTGVAAADVLNIRARPDAASPVIGTLGPNARGIEAVAEGKGWMQVNAGEQAGWVNARYLTPRHDTWQAGHLPPSLSCSGTEPFWSLRQAPGGLVLSTPDAVERRIAIRQILASGAFRDPQRSVMGQGLTAVITPAVCSDGMSDRVFGLDAVVLVGEAPGVVQLRGCCTVSGR